MQIYTEICNHVPGSVGRVYNNEVVAQSKIAFP